MVEYEFMRVCRNLAKKRYEEGFSCMDGDWSRAAAGKPLRP
jgi:hypothetical protein